MRCVFGADRPDSMELYMDGKPVQVNSVIQAINHGIGYATEDRKRDGLALGLDIQYNTNMAHLQQLSRWGFLNDKKGRKMHRNMWTCCGRRRPVFISSAEIFLGEISRKWL